MVGCEREPYEVCELHYEVMCECEQDPDGGSFHEEIACNEDRVAEECEDWTNGVDINFNAQESEVIWDLQECLAREWRRDCDYEAAEIACAEEIVANEQMEEKHYAEDDDDDGDDNDNNGP